MTSAVFFYAHTGNNLALSVESVTSPDKGIAVLFTAVK